MGSRREKRFGEGRIRGARGSAAQTDSVLEEDGKGSSVS